MPGGLGRTMTALVRSLHQNGPCYYKLVLCIGCTSCNTV